MDEPENEPRREFKGDWEDNTGTQPVPDGEWVQVIFRGVPDRLMTGLAGKWDWDLSGEETIADIIKWRPAFE